MLARYLSILDALAHAQRPLRIEEIASRAGFPVSTTYRLVRGLVDARLMQPQGGGAYWLGVKLLEYGGAVAVHISARDVALPVMRRISEQTGETVHLTIADGAEGVYVEKVESTVYQLRWHTEIGRRVPLYAGASMKILLAFMDPERREDILEHAELHRVAPHTVIDRALLREELEEIRRRGWAMSREEINEGAAGISAPVFDSRGELVAGLTVSGASSRFSDDRIGELSDLIRAGAAEVSAGLGARAAGEAAAG